MITLFQPYVAMVVMDASNYKDTGLQKTYSIHVYKEYLNFSASHFLIFADDTREPLHGHNYRVKVKGATNQLIDDMVFDFLDIKPIVKEVCDSLDHLLLLPGENPKVKITEDNGIITYEVPDGDVFQFPARDVKVLPIQNTSAERLANYLAREIHAIVLNRHDFKFEQLEVEVEESPGQSATYIFGGER